MSDAKDNEIKLKFWIPARGGTLDGAINFICERRDCFGSVETSLELSAEIFVNYYYNISDRVRAQLKWPIDVHIASAAGKFLGAVRVEYVPRLAVCGTFIRDD